MKIIIAPSLLSCDFTILKKEIKKISNADWLHLDIMDGHFVPNITFGPPLVKSIRSCTDLPLDCHLMVTEPEKWIKPLAKIGVNNITFHIEVMNHETDTKRLIEDIHNLGIKVGIAVKPNTNISLVYPYLDLVDMILIMTVEPGFGGQKFMESMIEKVKTIRSINKKINIQVDGGLNDQTSELSINAGANVIVSGSFIFKSNDPNNTISKLSSN